MQVSVLTIYTSQERASVPLRIPALRFLPSSNTEPHSPTEMITSLKSWGRISAAPTTSSAVSGEVSETTIIGTPALRPSAGLPPVLRRRNGWGCGAGPVHAGTQLAAGPRPPLPFSTIDIPRPMQAKRNQPKTPMCGARQAQRSWQFPIADWKSEPRHPGCRGEKNFRRIRNPFAPWHPGVLALDFRLVGKSSRGITSRCALQIGRVPPGHWLRAPERSRRGGLRRAP